MPYDKTKPYSCPCCGYWNGDMKYDYYKHKEPLIKDEKIRKAVRAWADANKIGSQDTICFNVIEHRFSWFSTAIEFDEYWALSDLEKEEYTIAELCGEEEE